MRKMKKINGYLVVKFNARELREYEGTALGEYGVIDAELYTGNLDVDRGAMEYDNAGSMEEAVELARGLESELDAEEPEVKVTIVKETDETTEEEEVDAQQMVAGWETVLRGQVESVHYKDVDERTAAHELYGYKVALRDLGLLDREDCYVLPDTFGEAPGPLPKKPEELLTYLLIVMLGTNDLLQGRSPEQAAERLERFLAGISMDRSKILLIAPPPVALGAWVPSQQLIDESRTFTRLCQTLAKQMGIRFADAGRWDIPLAYDGVHFTEQGHRAFATKLLEELK